MADMQAGVGPFLGVILQYPSGVLQTGEPEEKGGAAVAFYGTGEVGGLTVAIGATGPASLSLEIGTDDARQFQ